jgi:transcriptional regulator GlxA family with amidase domain
MTQEQAGPREIAFVAFEGLTPLDLVGPLQAFTVLGLLNPQYQAVVVAETLEPLATDGPLKLVADKTFEQVPSPYALMVPGGAAPAMRAMSNEPLLKYVRDAGSRAEIVTSTCTGALILAAAGVLEGRKATTHWAFSKQLERMGVEYVPDRWVEDGKFISSAGIAAGLDMALDVVGKLVGEGMARQVQLILEYDPQPPLGAIDWDQIDKNMLDPIVDGWINEGLAERPDLISRLVSQGS